jgi:hypothetical protein
MLTKLIYTSESKLIITRMCDFTDYRIINTQRIKKKISEELGLEAEPEIEKIQVEEERPIAITQ